MLPTGENTSTPHLTWSDQYFKEDHSVIVELAGCYKRYHCPLARTAHIGQPSEKLERLAEIVAEGIDEVMSIVKPGVVLEELEEAWRKATRRYGIEKESRLGYSMGLNYPPDWGGAHGKHTKRRSYDITTRYDLSFYSWDLVRSLWFRNE